MKKIEKLKELIQEAIDRIEVKSLIDKFNKGGIPYSLINSMKDIFDGNQQIKDLNMVNTVDTNNYGTLKYVRNPITYSKLNLEEMKSPPLLGEHTEEILKDVGFGIEEIVEFKKKGIIS